MYGTDLASDLAARTALRLMEPDERAKARRETVRRFSRVATVSILAILVTGLYATLLNVPSIPALIPSPSV